MLLNLPGDLRKLPSSFCAVSFSPCHKTPPYLLGCWKAGPIPTRHQEDGKGAEVLFTGRPCSRHRPAARQSPGRVPGAPWHSHELLCSHVCADAGREGEVCFIYLNIFTRSQRKYNEMLTAVTVEVKLQKIENFFSFLFFFYLLDH